VGFLRCFLFLGGFFGWVFLLPTLLFENMHSTYIFSEDLLAEQHRRILVEQLIEIVKQLKENPEQLPFVTFPPEECFSPTRDKRERSADSTARVSTIHRL
jgi:hypothetical protein